MAKRNIGIGNIDKGTYLIQFLRKYSLPDNIDLAKYLNSILLSLITDTNVNYNLTIHGSFWGHGKSAAKLVDNVFDGVNKSISIQLLNQYGSLNNISKERF